MKQEANYSMVIVLINEKSGQEIEFAKKWFANSRYDCREVTNIFQAMEEIDDFTTSHRPQVILLPINLLAGEFMLLKNTARCFSNHQSISFMALSGANKIVNHHDCFEGTLSELKKKLNEIIPYESPIGVAA